MMRYFFAFTVFLALFSCNDSEKNDAAENEQVAMDSTVVANNLVANDKRNITDTVFQTALPPVFDGDIIMQISSAAEPQLLQALMGGKYNHVGIIFQRERDGILMVMEMQDTVRMTQLTDFVARGVDGHVCLLRLKEAGKTLNEKKVKSLREAAKAYRKRPFDPVLNWDDSGLYSSELVWKVYNNAMMLRLCPTRTVADFKISDEKKAELKKKYNLTVSDRDEAVSVEDIYKSPKLEIIYEK